MWNMDGTPWEPWESDGYPADVAAELLLPCAHAGGDEETHRVWVLRDGGISTPDHFSEQEEVIAGLGGLNTHPCAYWQAVPLLLKGGSTHQGAVSRIPTPDQSRWQFASDTAWTPKAQWSAVTGVLGIVTFSLLHPPTVLAHAQAYRESGGLPDDPVAHIGQLESPWTRQVGYRRTRATTPEEVRGMLSAGVHFSRVAALAALDVTAAQAAEGLESLARLGLPADVLVNLATALPAERAISLLGRLTSAQGESVLVNLPKLRDAAHRIRETDIEGFLLGEPV